MKGNEKENESLQVCYAFLEFFDAHGGLKQFGYPISNLESHDGRFVQFFQKARFEWHPEYPSGQRVQLGDLGCAYFNQQAVDQNYLRQGENLPQTILSLKLRAFPEQAVSGMQGRQVINVIVQDQNLLPVANAIVSLQVFTPSSGYTFGMDAPSGARPTSDERNTSVQSTAPLHAQTDKNGLAQITLPFETNQPGLFTILLTAKLGELSSQSISSFRAWW